MLGEIDYLLGEQAFSRLMMHYDFDLDKKNVEHLPSPSEIIPNGRMSDDILVDVSSIAYLCIDREILDLLETLNSLVVLPYIWLVLAKSHT